MLNTYMKQNTGLSSRTMTAWFEELTLPVAPACNMMCNFCSKDSDCVCNGNSPQFLSKPMTPRQAVNWATLSAGRNRRIRVIRISGPGEPLCNHQTFEVLKRLNAEMPDYIFAVSTNGLLLKERAAELARLNVKMVDVAINAAFEETFEKLYARVMKDSNIVINSARIAGLLLESQLEGIRLCTGYGMTVKVNIVYFPGINEEDIQAIALKCREIGVSAIRIISCGSYGKLRRLRIPNIEELVNLQQKLAKIVPEVEIKNFS